MMEISSHSERDTFIYNKYIIKILFKYLKNYILILETGSNLKIIVSEDAKFFYSLKGTCPASRHSRGQKPL
jgi:hypothetical protein